MIKIHVVLWILYQGITVSGKVSYCEIASHAQPLRHRDIQTITLHVQLQPMTPETHLFLSVGNLASLADVFQFAFKDPSSSQKHVTYTVNMSKCTPVTILS